MELGKVKNGSTFKIGDVEFIKFNEENGKVTAVTKEAVKLMAFGKNNNLKESGILKYLETEFLPKIAEVIGEENILEFETDLFSIDGLNDYGKMKSKVSLPTFDFYRQNRKIFDDYKLNDWFWLSTPNGIDTYWVVCVSLRGGVGNFNYFNNFIGVRPFCIFDSSISVS